MWHTLCSLCSILSKKNISLPEITNKDNTNININNTKNNKFVLYFTYDDKEGYIELNGVDIYFNDIINTIYSKYNWVPRIGAGFFLQKGENMTEIENNKTIRENGLNYCIDS